jgi:hypothetical protein
MMPVADPANLRISGAEPMEQMALPALDAAHALDPPAIPALVRLATVHDVMGVVANYLDLREAQSLSEVNHDFYDGLSDLRPFAVEVVKRSDRFAEELAMPIMAERSISVEERPNLQGGNRGKFSIAAHVLRKQAKHGMDTVTSTSIGVDNLHIERDCVSELHTNLPRSTSATWRKPSMSTFAYNAVVAGWRCPRKSPISFMVRPRPRSRVAHACRKACGPVCLIARSMGRN